MKIKSLITHTALLLMSVIVLAACNWFGPPTPPPTPQPPEPPIEEPAKELSFATYFNNAATVSYTESVDNLNGENKYNLINNQLSTFVDNLFRRVLAVYGPGFNWDESVGTGETIAHLKLIGDGDTYSPHNLSSYEIIMNAPYTTSNIGKLADALKTGQWDASHQIVNQFNLKNSMNSWKYNLINTENELEAYNEYLGTYLNQLKLGVLKAVSGNSSNIYNSIISSITTFNLNNNQTKIVNYILDTVIGSGIKNQPDKLYRDVITQLVKATLEHREVEAIPTWQELNFITETSGVVAPISNKLIATRAYTNVRISPRKDTPITKLNLKISSATNLSGLEMTANVVINNRSVGTKVFRNISNRTSFYIDLNEFTGNHTTMTGNTNTTYVEFTFNNPQGLLFNISFDGYFDKVK